MVEDLPQGTTAHAIVGYALEDGVTRSHGDLEEYFHTLLAAGRKVRLVLLEKLDAPVTETVAETHQEHSQE